MLTRSAVICSFFLAASVSPIYCGGETFQFFLDILDKMDPTWVLSEHHAIPTKIQCASLCFRQKGTCAYFGYMDGTCHLLKDTVDRDTCSQEDCSSSGMKVYKWKQEITTTTEEPTTPTSTTTTTTEAAITTTTELSKTTTTEPTTTKKATTTTELSTTTTMEPTSTTTTAEPTTTTAKPTTTTAEPTTTTAEPTTNTTEPTTTTTDPTTTTTEPTTTTTEPTTTTTEPTTTTTEPTTTVETTTTEPTTTTTEPTTTTSEPTTTTTEMTTTTTDGGFTCEPPEGAEAELNCPDDTQLLRAMGSRSPFFMDVLGPTCTPMQEQVYGDEEEVYIFFSPDGGFSVNAKCPDENHVIVRFKVCVKDMHIPAITLHCRLLKDPDRIDDRYNATSDDIPSAVDCGDKAGLQKIFLMDAGDQVITRVVFECLLIHVEDTLPPVDAPAAGGP